MKTRTTTPIAIALLGMGILLLAGCAPAATNTPTDVVGSASVVDTAAAFEKAISKDGTWIIAITRDLTIDKDLVLEGDFPNGRKDESGNALLQRKIALYAQDASFQITSRYMLTAKSLTIRSAVASIQHGTFQGDLIVDVKGFKLIDATVEGNVYFTNEEYKASFVLDDKSRVTGVQEVKAG
jgi:hypothetical protein